MKNESISTNFVLKMRDPYFSILDRWQFGKITCFCPFKGRYRQALFRFIREQNPGLTKQTVEQFHTS
jgi:hypothetical protein